MEITYTFSTPSRAVGTMQPVDEEDVEARRALATQRNRAVWKEIEPEHDHFPTMSYSQHKLAYIPPAPGTTPTKHRKKSGDFGQFVDKAIKLKVNLSATAHE